MQTTAGADPRSSLSRLTIDGVEWTFSDSGDGPGPPLLVLPGALGMVDAAGAALRRLAEGRRVIALAYPAVPAMTALCDGIAALLDRLGLERVDVLGGSLGGWVAQCLARRHPERVRHLALSHTFALRPGDARRIRLGSRLWALIPDRVFYALLRMRLRQVLRPVRRAGPAEAASWDAWLRDGVRRQVSRAALARYNDWMLESLAAFRLAPGDLERREGRVLILESADDPILRARDRARLRALYPSAVVSTFHGAGHATSLAMPDEYAAAVAGFLDAETAVRECVSAREPDTTVRSGAVAVEASRGL
ncbi:MAG TPA: alpha/beta hydrolase [Longimicrobium sp.]|jgi:pimeloyl-ACP methyl ester carboxylesterase